MGIGDAELSQYLTGFFFGLLIVYYVYTCSFYWCRGVGRTPLDTGKITVCFFGLNLSQEVLINTLASDNM